MSDVVLAEGIYVKRSKGSMGIGGTARECVMESLWFPLRAENGFVELFPVMDNLKSLLRLFLRIQWVLELLRPQEELYIIGLI